MPVLALCLDIDDTWCYGNNDCLLNADGCYENIYNGSLEEWQALFETCKALCGQNFIAFEVFAVTARREPGNRIHLLARDFEQYLRCDYEEDSKSLCDDYFYYQYSNEQNTLKQHIALYEIVDGQKWNDLQVFDYPINSHIYWDNGQKCQGFLVLA